MLNRLVFAVFALCGASTLSATALSQASQKHATGMIQTAGLKTSSSAMPASVRGSHLLPNPVIPPIEAIAPAGAAPASNTTSNVTGATFEYDRVGNRTRMTLSNGVVTDYVYDARYRLRELHTHKDGVTIQRHVYTVDASGLRTGVESTETDGTIRVLTFNYDPLKRLISEVHAENGVEVFDAAYSYDKVGNRTRAIVNGVTTDYVYNVNDWLISETTVGGSMPGVTTYTYDDNGNRLSKSGPLGIVEYRYNDANRMVELLDGGERIVYGYDVDGLLVEKTFFKVGLPPLTQRFVWDTNRDIAQVIEEWVSPGDSTPHVSATYLFADELIAQTRNGVTSFVLADGMGSTRALADTGGAVTDTFRYDAFGNVIGRTGSTPADHLYRGEQLDPNAGFYYLRARWMDPRIGQFTQMDSLAGFAFDPATMHRYNYTPSDPVNFVDPSGKSFAAEQVTAAGIAAILATAAYLTIDFVVRPHSKETDRRFGVWDAVAVTQFRASSENDRDARTDPVSDVLGGAASREAGHHTIPTYLCGDVDQEVSSIRLADHAAIHAQVAAIRIALAGAEEYASKVVGYHRSQDILSIAQTYEGRVSIAEALSKVYYYGGWDSKGRRPIRDVFNSERPAFESGRKTSLPWCGRTGKP